MITIGFSSHRIEALPYIRKHMERHQVIVLEEPAVPEFSEMLEGRLSIDEYMMTSEAEFPEFERQMCVLLRDLHESGQHIVQVEPYLEGLLQIHEILSQGKTPQDIVRDPRLEEVYRAEKRATGTLLSYYTQALQAPFEGVIEALKAFAQADADRLVLRGRLRARAIHALALGRGDTYVEAGYLHYPLYRFLRKAAGHGCKVRVVYLLAPVVRRLHGKRRNMGPGDILTLHYALGGTLSKGKADLLAARSLIYIKLIQKDEVLPGVSNAPHTEDETGVNRVVDQLSMEACKVLFDNIRLAKREQALQLVQAYLMQSSKQP
ncbi:MAG: hypothetical protein PVJ62_00420 [Deltaproteobacteria bacterium]|jgi:hypothetical protein